MRACNKLDKIWKYNLTRPSKIKLFQATVESILLYGSETWTVTTKIRKMLDGCYTRLLRSALNISWKAHVTNEQLYGDLPKVSDKIKKRRLQFAGHCLRSSGQVVSDLVLWKPVHGKRGAGRPIMTYVDLLCQDTGQTPAEIKTCMENRCVWRAITDVRQMSTEWVSEWVPKLMKCHNNNWKIQVSVGEIRKKCVSQSYAWLIVTKNVLLPF